MSVQIDVHKNDLSRILIAHDRPARQIEEGLPVVAGKPAGPWLVQPLEVRQKIVPSVPLHHLQGSERGKSLQLDQLRNERAILADYSKVDLREAWQGVDSRRVPSRRDGPLHLLQPLRIGELGQDLLGRDDDLRLEIVR